MDTDEHDAIAAGRAALADCHWAAAERHFTRALAESRAAEAVDGLGQARYWQGDHSGAIALREEAFGLMVRDGNALRAAGIAVRLAMLHGLVYGNGTAVGGWLAQARRLLDGAESSVEAGWYLAFMACTAAEPEEHERQAAAAVDVARAHRDANLEFDALAYLGKSWVERGDVPRGMALIDEALAAVTSGLVDDVWAQGEIYCTLFHACEMTADVQRADGWMGAVDRYVERTRELPISGICRMHFGGLLTAAGRWTDAERELQAAMAIYAEGYTGTRHEAALRLADLRARQGRLDDAEGLLAPHRDRAGAAGPRARIHLARGEATLAAAALERHLARRGRGVLSADELALLVEVELAREDVDTARAVALELTELAARSGLVGLDGLAASCRGRVAASNGELDAAVSAHEHALACFAEAGRTLDHARTQLALAVLLAPREPEVAAIEGRAALTTLDAQGARLDADRAAALLRSLGDHGRRAPRIEGPLTHREVEVLELVAVGLRNRDIAARLHISPRTVEDHVSRILGKLGATSRTEAVAIAGRTGRLDAED